MITNLKKAAECYPLVEKEESLDTMLAMDPSIEFPKKGAVYKHQRDNKLLSDLIPLELIQNLADFGLLLVMSTSARK